MSDSNTTNPAPGRTIGEHGIIGNLDTAALVASDGAIDFMPWPHLDSPTIFAGLLDPEGGGTFEVSPLLPGARTVQLYLADTNALVTRWLSDAGSAEVVDFMPHPEACDRTRTLIRRVKVTRGTITFELRCRPRMEYGRVVPDVAAVEGGISFATRGREVLHLRSDTAMEAGSGEARGRFVLGKGEGTFFALLSPEDEPIDAGVVAQLEAATVSAWRSWAAASNYRGRWREQVARSALALKLLTSRAHGSIAAAATFGLPETPGGERNWDYRATWMRDAAFTVYAFMRLGYTDEAERFRRWVSERVRAASGSSNLKIMYALDGSDVRAEEDLPHLAGYGGARPVRIGNDAHGQRQLDIYGELMDSLYLSNRYGSAVSHETWLRVSETMCFLCDHWEEPDAGIWELRGPERHHLHSRLMCWVALDRAVRLARKRSLPAPAVEWERARDQIAADIWANFRHPEKGHFVSEKNGTELDSALLMMPLVRFVSATDPVWLLTLDAIGTELTDDGMVRRYRTDDGLPGEEGSFTTCMFWYVECLARAGRIDDARHEMTKGLSYANHLGLFSEELDRFGRQLGNFPQALTHLALISAAVFLDRRLDDPSGGEWQP